MKYIHSSKIYPALRVYNRQNNSMPGASTFTNLLQGKGLLLTPDIQGARNYISLSFTVAPEGVTELFRLFASSNTSTNTIRQDLTISDSSLLPSITLMPAASPTSSIITRNAPGKSEINLSSVLLNTHEWRTVLVTIDSVLKTCSLYIDGNIFGTITTASTIPDLTNFLQSYFFSNFIGTIRSFQIWGSSFNSSEAAQLNTQLYTDESTLATHESFKRKASQALFAGSFY
jgi:hypothetical protein